MAEPQVELAKLLPNEARHAEPRSSISSVSSASMTSLILDQLGEFRDGNGPGDLERSDHKNHTSNASQIERRSSDNGSVETHSPAIHKRPGKRWKRASFVIPCALVCMWILMAFIFVARRSMRSSAHDPNATTTFGTGKKIELEQVLTGQFGAKHQQIRWITGADGEDGMMLEQGMPGKDFIVVEDVRRQLYGSEPAVESQTLMSQRLFTYQGEEIEAQKLWPSRDLRKVLIATDVAHNWRYSYFARYFILDVATQNVELLDPDNNSSQIQVAIWSPTSDAIVFTWENNMFIRRLSSDKVISITHDGGVDAFYGVPDWAYAEEVFRSNIATWWSEDGQYIAFLRTNESQVPEYPVQFFASRPSDKKPLKGSEYYPEQENIKYPKAGAPNPIVQCLFYDLAKDEVFNVPIPEALPSDDRIISEVTWAGSTGQIIVQNTNREGYILEVIVVDVATRTGSIVRRTDMQAIDGGWVEISQSALYVPADAANGRPDDGYMTTITHEGYNHLAYFSPLTNCTPRMLTSGQWEVVAAPSAVDLKNNLVYFVSTKESSTERHVYSVKLDGTGLEALTDTSTDGYYNVKFSAGSGYALISYEGPSIPWQKVVTARLQEPNQYSHVIEDNKELAANVSKYNIPILAYSIVTIDGFPLNVIERRPPNFSPDKQYPVLFYVYGGPGSQNVDKRFMLDFNAYLCAALDYIVVTVDGRGTGFTGRASRVSVMGNLGALEAHDQIATAKMWALRSYVDASRMAIWGWSYGGYTTLKTLELDAGETFAYGMAVAPVTDWRLYDSIFTERFMHTPAHNPDGYENASITNVSAIAQAVRFLVMHGVADDNVHVQNTMRLLELLDLGGVLNYDMHMFPDSNHAITFDGAHRIVFGKLENWIVNAFNGEWLRTADAKPIKGDVAG